MAENMGQSMATRLSAPSNGGTDASSIEAYGGFGEHGEGGMTTIAGKSDDGDHQMIVNTFGPGPHSGANPENFEGTLGETPADPTRAQG